MSKKLTLKKPLALTDEGAAHLLNRDPNNPWTMRQGRELPSGPLDPLYAMAYAKAGLILEDKYGHRYVWDKDGSCLVTTNKEPLPLSFYSDLKIVGHQDPEVL